MRGVLETTRNRFEQIASGHAGNRRTHHSQREDAHKRPFFGHVPGLQIAHTIPGIDGLTSL